MNHSGSFGQITFWSDLDKKWEVILLYPIVVEIVVVQVVDQTTPEREMLNLDNLCKGKLLLQIYNFFSLSLPPPPPLNS